MNNYKFTIFTILLLIVIGSIITIGYIQGNMGLVGFALIMFVFLFFMLLVVNE